MRCWPFRHPPPRWARPSITRAGWSRTANLAIHLGAGGSVILNWPNPSTGFALQQTSNLGAPGGGWVDVPDSPVVVGSNKEITLPATGPFRLFRLRRP